MRLESFGRSRRQGRGLLRLLVSLHVLALSAIPASRSHTPAEMFELNRFQQFEIERQEQLRQQLGMRTDVPLRYGLANWGIDPVEDQIAFNVKLLQAMDRLSLVLCCRNDGNAPPLLFERIDDLPPRPGSLPLIIRLSRTKDDALIVDPWPFDAPAMSFTLSGRKIPATAYPSRPALFDALAQSSLEPLTVSLRAPEE